MDRRRLCLHGGSQRLSFLSAPWGGSPPFSTGRDAARSLFHPGWGLSERGVHCGVVRWRGRRTSCQVDARRVCLLARVMNVYSGRRVRGRASMRHAMHSLYKGAAEMVMPVRSTSAFKEKGVRVLTSTPPRHLHRRPTRVYTRSRWSVDKLSSGHLASRRLVVSSAFRATCPLNPNPRVGILPQGA